MITSPSRSDTMPALTEQGAGNTMLKADKAVQAAASYRSDVRAQAMAKQINRSRQESATAKAQQEADVRKQVLLEMIYVHAVQGMPLDAIATQVYTPQEMAQLHQLAGPGVNPAMQTQPPMATGAPAGPPMPGQPPQQGQPWAIPSTTQQSAQLMLAMQGQPMPGANPPGMPPTSAPAGQGYY